MNPTENRTNNKSVIKITEYTKTHPEKRSKWSNGQNDVIRKRYKVTGQLLKVYNIYIQLIMKRNKNRAHKLTVTGKHKASNRLKMNPWHTNICLQSRTNF